MNILILATFFASGTALLVRTWVPSGRYALAERIAPRRHYSPIFAIDRQSLVLWWRRRFHSRRAARAALHELPDILEMLAVSLSAGEGIFAALARVVPRSSGVLPSALQSLLIALQLGANLEAELMELARRLPQQQVVEFSSKLALSLRRGSPLAQMLREQAASARAEIRNELFRQAGRNDTRMLVPLVFLILPVTVLFAIYPSLQLINISYL